MIVEKMMTKKPIFITVPNSRREVLALLVKHHKTGMPVLDDDENVVGLITRKMMFEKPEEEQLALLMMEDPPTVSPSSKVEKAAKIMYDYGIYHVPVVKNKKLVGVITPTDILHVLVERKVQDSVEDYLTKQCVPIYQDTSLAAAASIIKITKTYSLPVLNPKGTISGLITDRDIYNLSYVNEKTALVEMGISSDEDDWTWEGLRNVIPLYFEESKLELPPIAVKEIMIKDPETVYLKTSLAKVANIMLKNDYAQLPVRDEDDNLVSLVYDLDILKAIYEQ